MSITPLSPSLQESAPLAHILCLAGQEWPLTAGLKFRGNTVMSVGCARDAWFPIAMSNWSLRRCVCRYFLQNNVIIKRCFLSGGPRSLAQASSLPKRCQTTSDNVRIRPVRKSGKFLRYLFILFPSLFNKFLLAFPSIVTWTFAA